MTLGIVLLQGPRRVLFLMSEVPLYLVHTEVHPPRIVQRAHLALQGYLAHKKTPSPGTLR